LADFTFHSAPGYYAHLLEAEIRPISSLPDQLQQVLLGHESFNSELVSITPAVANSTSKLIADGPQEGQESTELTTIKVADLAQQSVSVALSQVHLLDSDSPQNGDIVFPKGKLDGDAQQVDLSKKNSWRLQLEDISTIELVEVTTVNSLAPFVLNARLKPLLEQSPYVR